MTHPVEQLKHVADAAATGTVIGTLATWLPPIAAGFAIVWYLLRMYEWFEFGRFKKK